MPTLVKLLSLKALSPNVTIESGKITSFRLHPKKDSSPIRAIESGMKTLLTSETRKEFIRYICRTLGYCHMASCFIKQVVKSHSQGSDCHHGHESLLSHKNPALFLTRMLKGHLAPKAKSTYKKTLE